MVTIALAVIASLVLSQNPVAAQSTASEQYGEATSSADASASPSASVEPTHGSGGESSIGKSAGGDDGVSQGSATNVEQREAPSGPNGDSSSGSPDADSGRGGEGRDPAPNVGGTPLGDASSPNDSTSTHEGGAASSDSGASFRSILPEVFPQEEQPESENTTAPSAPQAAVEGLLNGLNELHSALNSLLDTMMSVFPIAAEQPAKPETETNTTAPPSDTQNTPVQQGPSPDNAPGSSEVGEDPSANSAPPSDSNDGQVPSGNTSSPGDPNAPWPESGCNDPSVLTPQQAFECTQKHFETSPFLP
jgi:hypothetical protein